MRCILFPLHPSQRESSLLSGSHGRTSIELPERPLPEPLDLSLINQSFALESTSGWAMLNSKEAYTHA